MAPKKTPAEGSAQAPLRRAHTKSRKGCKTNPVSRSLPCKLLTLQVHNVRNHIGNVTKSCQNVKAFFSTILKPIRTYRSTQGGGCEKRQIRCSFQVPESAARTPLLPWNEELDLFYYFTVMTSNTLSRGHDLEIWQVTVPRAACQHDFLLDSIPEPES